MALLEVRDLVKVYRSAESPWGATGSELRAVDGVSFDVDFGETLGVVGESGCGKTTLGRLILRLVEPTSGSVTFNGRSVTAGDKRELRRMRRDMQIVFQDPYGSLNPRMTVRDILAEPFKIHGASTEADVGGSSGARARAAGAISGPSELLRAVGLDESALGRYPHEFSGGQRQRIAIARALALNPKFIVADEPVSSLDVSLGAQIINLLQKLQREFGLTYLFISHSLPLVRFLANRIAVMQRGKIVEIGESEQVISNPQHPYTMTLLKATPGV